MDDGFSSHLIGRVCRSSPTPLYYQLFSLLKDSILDGTLALGLRLPPEEQLADLAVPDPCDREFPPLQTRGVVDDLRAAGNQQCVPLGGVGQPRERP